MKLIRENTEKFKPIFGSFAEVETPVALEPDKVPVLKKFNKPNIYSGESAKWMELVNLFIQSSDKITDKSGVINNFYTILRQIIRCKRVVLLLYDESTMTFNPADDTFDEEDVHYFNALYKRKNLDWMFESNEIITLQYPGATRTGDHSLNYVLFPVKEKNEILGTLVFLTASNSDSIKRDASKTINILLNVILSKLKSIKRERILKSTYKDLQLYQSKLANDFKLSAVGEMTFGIIEEIMSPLQVIMSLVDMLKSEVRNSSKESLNKIEEQIHKVKGFASHLSKFADVKNDRTKIFPCDINEAVENYITVVKTFIKYKNYECIVDLNSEIPPILSNTTYLYQIFTVLFSILKSGFGKSGGILVQSFYINEEVIIKFITTDYIQKSVLATNNLDTELNLRIVKNLMRKHKGILKIEGTPMTGTQLIIKFPVRRDLI